MNKRNWAIRSECLGYNLNKPSNSATDTNNITVCVAETPTYYCRWCLDRVNGGTVHITHKHLIYYAAKKVHGRHEQ